MCMKNFVLIAITILTLLSSCKKDDEGVSANSIVGTWISTENKITGCTDEASNGTFTFDCPTNCRIYLFAIDTITIDQNGEEQTIINQLYSQSITTNGTTVNESGTFSLNAGLITLCYENDEEEEICRNLNISFNGDNLFIFNTNDQTGCEEQTTYTQQ